MKNEHEYIAQLENVIGQMLTPLKNIPFSVVIKAITGKTVLKFDRESADDAHLLDKLVQAARLVGKMVAADGGISRPRPNEVGNDLEAYVEGAIKQMGYTDVCSPTGLSGRGRSVGYPDRVFTDTGRAVYIEVKSYSESTASTSMRSFYFSPSSDFKVTNDGLHLMLAFETLRDGNNFYVIGWKIATAENLLVDVKYEFNSDNTRLYADGAILAQEKFDFTPHLPAS